MPPTVRLARTALLALGACTVLTFACYQVPEVRDYYACGEDADCGGDGGFVCDDGVCCRERETPVCVGRVLDGGTCLDGGTPSLFFEDLDEDGFGNPIRPLYRCAPPQAVPTVTNRQDCNDNPTAGGRLFFPGAPEQCDGYDNDCDTIADDGLDGRLYYRDEDNDGFGNPGQAQTFCQQPVGWVENPDDCGPTNGAVHPGGFEVCNGLDDDCNRQLDDTSYIGQPCTVPNRLGVCAQGQKACVSGRDTCRQVTFPVALDMCNAKDDDCDGTTDERPDCGGPLQFFTDPSVVKGARHLDVALQGGPGGCLKSAYGNATPADTISGDVWSGSGSNSHVFWVERDGGTWDLSRPQSALRLHVTVSTSGGTATNPDGGLNRWAKHRQPVVLVCGPAGFLRLVPVSPILDSASTEFINRLIPLPPDGGTWVIGANSTTDTQAVLRQVKRVEFLIQPESTTTPVSFSANFDPDFGFP